MVLGAVTCTTIITLNPPATSFQSGEMAKSGRRSRCAQLNGGGGAGGGAGGISVSGCAPTGRLPARAFRLWLFRALPVILILMMLILILGSYLCSYPGISDSPKHSADLLKDKVNIKCKMIFQME